MNYNAFDIIEELDLPHPPDFSLDEIVGGDVGECFYFRYAEGCAMPNQVLSFEQINRRFLDLSREFNKGELVKIEKVYKSVVGGATLIKPNFSYTECVSGHLCALLRNGLCSGRFLLENGELSFSTQTFQGWRAEQQKGSGFSWKPANGLTDGEFSDVIKRLKDKLPQSHSGLFLEWFMSEEGLVFCDARNTGFEGFGDSLLELSSNKKPIVIQGRVGERQRLRVDELNMDLLSPPQDGDDFLICNGALLSHFVMRNRNKGIGIKLGVDYD